MRAQKRILAVISLLIYAAPVMAHHSFAAEFNADQMVTVTGTLTKLEWINPHVYFTVDVKDADGRVEAYSIETFNPSWLHRAGVQKDMFKLGDAITFEAWTAKDGSKHLLFAKNLHLSDGRTIKTVDDNFDPKKYGQQ